MPKVNERDIFEIKEWLNDTPQNVEEYEKMVGGSAPSGTIEISANGEYDVSEYATAKVEVEGGGSSDFSTATVTISVSMGAEVMILGSMIDPEGDVLIPERPIILSGDYTFVLYKGLSDIGYSPLGETNILAEVSGNITKYDDHLSITGDGTITFTVVV